MKINNWIRNHKIEIVFIVIILLVGGFFRFYGITDFMHFGGDEARDSFLIRSIARDGDIQLLGPSISPTEQATYLGPFYYYFLVPAYWMSGNSPTSGAITTAIFSFISIGLLYFIARKWYGVVAAITSSFLYAVSWIVVYYGRWAWNPNMIPFFILSLIICLYYIVQVNEKYKPWWLYGAALIIGSITQLHGTVLFVLPPFLVIYFLIFRPRIKWYKYLIALLIILILFTPLIYFDLNNNFSNTHGFISLLTERETNGDNFFSSFIKTYNKFFVFYHESLTHKKIFSIFSIVFASSLVYLFFQTSLYIKRRKKDSKNTLMLLWFFIPFIIFIFYDNLMPPHYFSMVFPLSFLLVGGLLQFLSKIKWMRILVVIIPFIFGSILMYNSINILVDLQPDGSRASTYAVTYSELERVAEFVINDSQGQPYRFESRPIKSYNRSYEYVFDQLGYGLNYEDPVNEYIAIVGKDSNIKEYINSQDNYTKYGFGNIIVLKKHPKII